MNESYVVEQRLATLEQRASESDDRDAEIHRRLDELETALFGDPTELAEWREVEQQSITPRPTEPDPGIAERLRRVSEMLARWPPYPDGFVRQGVVDALAYSSSVREKLERLLDKSEAAKRVAHAAIDSRIDQVTEQVLARLPAPAKKKKKRGKR